MPPVVETADALAEVVARFAAGTGPVAVDAERASGYRYSQRAYLVQLRRAGAGTALIDPIACPDLSALSDALDGVEWVLHAASQDLACLAEVGMVPSRMFDTELGGRLAGFERVGLGRHGRERPGPAPGEGPLRRRLVHPPAARVVAGLRRPRRRGARRAARRDRGRCCEARASSAWASEEFEAVRLALPPPPRVDPWRRTSGMHRLRTRRQLAAVRALWEVRDAMARRRDTAPGRILPDSAIVGAVAAAPASPGELLELPVFGGRATRRHVDAWFAALQSAAALPDAELPQPVPAGDGPPAANRWAERDPVAAKRLARVRAVVTGLAEQHGMPPENLVQPDAVRRLAWQPPALSEGEAAVEAVAAALSAHGARPWQVQIVAAPVAAVLPDPPAAAPDPPAAAPAAPTRRRPAPDEPEPVAPVTVLAPAPSPRVRRVRRATSPAGAPAPRGSAAGTPDPAP